MRQANAPVEVITDHMATRRVVDMIESDAERLERGLRMLDEAYEVLAPLNRQMEWHLEARKAACSIDEVCK